MSNLNPHNENNSMSDARLDELLDLAKPKLESSRQKALRRTVGQTLISNRPSWWSLFQSNASNSRPTVVSLLVVGCCLLTLAGLSWLAAPNTDRTPPVAVAVTTGSNAFVKSTTLSGSELAKLYPPIISRSKARVKSNKLRTNKTIHQGTVESHARASPA